MRWRRFRRRLGVGAPRLAIRTHMAWYWRLFLVLGSGVLVLVLASWIYDAGRNVAGFDSRASEARLDALRGAVSELESELKALRTSVGVADSQLTIERAVQQQLSRQVKALEAENTVLKQDLAFFEGLVPQSVSGEGGIHINRFRVDSEGTAGQYRYRMLLLYNGGGAKDFQGELQFLLKLRQGKEDVMMSLPAEAEARSQRYRVSVKRFQRLEGVFTLPSGAILKSVEVRVLSEGAVRARQLVNL